MKRMLVEFYDTDMIYNLFSLFACKYDEVVYVCAPEDEDRLNKTGRALSKFVEKNFGLAPRFVRLGESTIQSGVDCLRDLVREGWEYCFDMTGGSSLLIAAMGVYMATEREKPITLFQYDVRTGRRVLCYPGIKGYEPPEYLSPEISIRELIALNGGKLLGEGQFSAGEKISPRLRDDIITLWDAVREEIRAWNNFCTLQDDTPELSEYFVKRVPPGAERHYREIARRLIKAGIMKDLHEAPGSGYIEVSYKLTLAPESMFILHKGGNLLEMVSYLTAVESGLFGQCLVGATLEWDAATHDPSVDPVNELDLILSKGHRPVFSSCKGTQVENDYLYEIMTMTRHFGGREARPMIISGPSNKPAVRKRAQEMGITLIDNACGLSATKLTEKWRRLFGKGE